MATSEHSPATEPSQEPYWHEHFARWRESGLSQNDYCRQVGLSRHRFKYWRRKLEPAAVKRRRRKPGSDFVPLRVQPSTVAPGLTLTLPNGMVVRGIEAGNVELVRQLVAGL